MFICFQLGGAVFMELSGDLSLNLELIGFEMDMIEWDIQPTTTVPFVSWQVFSGIITV